MRDYEHVSRDELMETVRDLLSRIDELNGRCSTLNTRIAALEQAEAVRAAAEDEAFTTALYTPEP